MEKLHDAMRFNPFSPGNIVNPGMFAGRLAELKALERVLIQTDFGNPHHFMICGERGIGKSSLLLYVDGVARGRIKTFSDTTLQFLTVGIVLEPTTSYLEIVKRIGSELNRVVSDHQKIQSALKAGWDFLKRWEVMGVKYSEGSAEPDPHELLDDLTHGLAKTVEKGLEAAAFQGVLITIDEADKPGPKAQLGEFCKLFTEQLSKRGCNNVALGLAGLPKLVGQLRASHESSPRIFEEIHLEALDPDDRKRAIHLGLAAANSRNKQPVGITDTAADLISNLSEGYPHFIQQFAYCAFDEDDDNEIGIEDVYSGAFRPNGAIHQLGVKYFHELYWEQIGSDEYREVLRAMAPHFDQWVTKQQIRKAVEMKESTLTNALTALRKRNIILSRTGQKGVYRLPTRSFAVWIRASTSAQSAVTKSTSDENAGPQRTEESE